MSFEESSGNEAIAVRAFRYLRKRVWLVGIIAIVSLGTFGAALKYLDDDAQKQKALKPKDRSLLSSINPFLAMPTPAPTPQLSKEYIYAGSRLLAVEDANANAAPPGDLAVWRPSNGNWYVMGGTGSAQTTQGWGLSGDIPVPGDYDGDGKTDFSVFRPSESKWYIFYSSDSSSSTTVWGMTGDKPAPADYDGDGKTDRAIYRPNDSSTGLAKWYILQSSDSAQVTFQHGLPTDLPAPADYDGDGRADRAVWRDSDTNFYSVTSSNNTFNTVDFSVSSTTPVSADYDGDGKANYAVRSGAAWVIMNAALTSTSSTTPSGDLSTDEPVPNDYDGDGLCDLAVWRNSNGNWYIRQSASSNSLRQVAWGLSGDIPVPAYFRR